MLPKMFKNYTGKFYCFSPPVMLATFLFEFGAALYVIWKYKKEQLTKLVVAMLLALGTFQLAEYMICGGLGLPGSDWARLGYVSITLLPAIGIHIITTLAGKKAPLLVGAAYLSMVAFGAYFAFTPGAINSHECRANYAVFDLHDMTAWLYGAYYYGWLVVGTVLAWFWSRGHKHQSALLWMSAGYLMFMLPTATVNLIDPSTIAGIPSIMCGFAVLLAIVLVAKVMPSAGAVKQEASARDKKRHA